VKRHPNIVRYLDHAVDSGNHLHIVMEYADEGDLPTYVATMKAAGTWSLLTAVRLAVEIADGLRFAHSLGLEHRDIKPDNVLISAAGTAMIGDWGLARGHSVESGTSTKGVGSPLWMAPEVLSMLPSDKAADVWSLAIVWYQLLCGNFPDASDTSSIAQTSPFFDPHTGAATLLANVLTKPPSFDRLPADVPTAVRDLLASMLNKKPAERPTMAAVHARLSLVYDEMMSGGGTSAASTTAAAGAGGGTAAATAGKEPTTPTAAITAVAAALTPATASAAGVGTAPASPTSAGDPTDAAAAQGGQLLSSTASAASHVAVGVEGGSPAGRGGAVAITASLVPQQLVLEAV